MKVKNAAYSINQGIDDFTYFIDTVAANRFCDWTITRECELALRKSRWIDNFSRKSEITRIKYLPKIERLEYLPRTEITIDNLLDRGCKYYVLDGKVYFCPTAGEEFNLPSGIQKLIFDIKDESILPESLKIDVPV